MPAHLPSARLTVKIITIESFSFLAPYYDLRVPGLGLGASLFELRPHKSPFGLRPHKQGSGFMVFGNFFS